MYGSYNKVLSPLKKLSKQKNNYTAYLFNNCQKSMD